MSEENHLTHLPLYYEFVQLIDVLALPFSASELHGMMSGYLCAGANAQGETYLRALLGNKKDTEHRNAALALFSLYSFSQQQMYHFDFEFELLLPKDDAPLVERALAFSQWCDGFVQGLTVSGIGQEHFSEDEAQEALQHFTEFAQLDVDALDIDENDEKALVEVSEYARMAVLRLHGDLVNHEKHRGDSKITH